MSALQSPVPTTSERCELRPSSSMFIIPAAARRGHPGAGRQRLGHIQAQEQARRSSLPQADRVGQSRKALCALAFCQAVALKNPLSCSCSWFSRSGRTTGWASS